MTIYVDDRGHYGRITRLCRVRHQVFADSLPELELAADRVGASRRLHGWGPATHLLVNDRQRAELLAGKAEPLTWPEDVARLVAERRASGQW